MSSSRLSTRVSLAICASATRSLEKNAYTSAQAKVPVLSVAAVEVAEEVGEEEVAVQVVGEGSERGISCGFL